jgi:hypothetical protein
MIMNIPVVDQGDGCEKVDYIWTGRMSARFSPATK